MTTHLAAVPMCDDQLDLLSLVADNATPLGSLHRDDFRAACETVGRANGGKVDPNAVSALLHTRFGEINPNWYSAQWAPACGPNGFMDRTSEPVQIDGKHSKGNGNKTTVYRRLRCACPPCPGRGNDGHGLTHCAECCFGTGVEADMDCPTHGMPSP